MPSPAPPHSGPCLPEPWELPGAAMISVIGMFQINVINTEVQFLRMLGLKDPRMVQRRNCGTHFHVGLQPFGLASETGLAVVSFHLGHGRHSTECPQGQRPHWVLRVSVPF